MSAPRTAPARRRPGGLVAVLVLVLAGAAAGEIAGWPFLAAPFERLASQALGRPVLMRAEAGTAAPATPWRLRLLGGLRLSAPRLVIGAPDWSSAPHLLAAREVDLALRYVDLWRAWHGEPLQVRRLQARTLDAWMERRDDGRASWQFGTRPKDAPGAAPVMPVFEWVQLDAGHLKVLDAPLALDLDAEMSLVDGTAMGPAPAASGTPASATAGQRLQVLATGRYRHLPVRLAVSATGRLPWVAPSRQAAAVPMTMALEVGRARLDFQGTAQGVWHLEGMSGRFKLRGPSLAAVGAPLGVTLPTTAPFLGQGRVVKQGRTWRVVFDDATVGRSQLQGAFSYETGRATPLLAGRLGGRRLMLADLGPAIGGEPPSASEAGAPRPAGVRKLLPDRRFDLPALRAMDADVAIAIDEVDLNHPRLHPLRPLRAQLLLAGGVLRLSELDARTGHGRLQGELQLDGRGDEALWQARLAWHGVQLEQWIAQPRARGAPPYIAGRLQGHADVQGRGRSTAEILGSLSGRLRTDLRNGAVSHLAIEAAGIDLAQGLGVWIRGDDALPVHCAVASLVAEQGVLRPALVVLDTSDSTVWVDGSLSLASETLDLRAVVTPRDFSPLTLRAPLHLRGPFSAPTVSLDRSKLGIKLAASVALAFVNPLAALIPLVDPGDADRADRAASGCEPLVQRARRHADAPPAEAPAARR